MELDQFAREALRTESVIPACSGVSAPNLYLLLCMAASIGDLLDKVKNAIFNREPIDEALFNTSLENLRDLLSGMPEYISASALTDTHESAPVNGSDNRVHQIDLPALASIDTRILHACIGAITETSGIAQALVKALEGERLDIANLAEEFGDLCWYSLGLFPSASGIHHGKILESNIVKLAVRYPDKFSEFLAHDHNRDLADERKALLRSVK